MTTGATSVHAVDLPFGRVSAMRFPAGLQLQMHQHPRATVAVILRGGFAGSYNHLEHECTATNVVVEPAGESHANRFGDARSTILTLSLNEHALQGPFTSLVQGVRFARDPFATQVARRAEAELNTPDDLTPMAVESAALELLTRLSRSARSEGRPGWLTELASISTTDMRIRCGSRTLPSRLASSPSGWPELSAGHSVSRWRATCAGSASRWRRRCSRPATSRYPRWPRMSASLTRAT